MLENDNNNQPMDTRATSEHLAKCGYPTAEATFAKYRTQGGGSAFIRYGRRIYYRPSALAAWLPAARDKLRGRNGPELP